MVLSISSLMKTMFVFIISCRNMFCIQFQELNALTTLTIISSHSTFTWFAFQKLGLLCFHKLEGGKVWGGVKLHLSVFLAVHSFFLSVCHCSVCWILNVFIYIYHFLSGSFVPAAYLHVSVKVITTATWYG